jgi:hypothetical protein
MKFTVGTFERFLDPADIFDNFQLLDHVDIDTDGIADQSEDGLMGAFALMDMNILGFDPALERIELPFIGIIFQDDDHFAFSVFLI